MLSASAAMTASVATATSSEFSELTTMLRLFEVNPAVCATATS